MPDSRKTGASASWIAWAMSTASIPCMARHSTAYPRIRMRGPVAGTRAIAHHPAVTASTFKDHFSRQSADYSRYRPAYPAALIAYLAAPAPGPSAGGRLRDRQRPGGGPAGGAFRRGARGRRQRGPVAAGACRTRACATRARSRSRCRSADGSVALVAVGAGRPLVRLRPLPRRVPARPRTPRGVLAVWTYTVFRAGGEVDAIVDRFYTDDRPVLAARAAVRAGAAIARCRSRGARSAAADSKCRPNGRWSRRSAISPAGPSVQHYKDRHGPTHCRTCGMSFLQPGPPAARFVSAGRSTSGSAAPIPYNRRLGRPPGPLSRFQEHTMQMRWSLPLAFALTLAACAESPKAPEPPRRHPPQSRRPRCRR